MSPRPAQFLFLKVPFTHCCIPLYYDLSTIETHSMRVNGCHVRFRCFIIPPLPPLTLSRPLLRPRINRINKAITDVGSRLSRLRTQIYITLLYLLPALGFLHLQATAVGTTHDGQLLPPTQAHLPQAFKLARTRFKVTTPVDQLHPLVREQSHLRSSLRVASSSQALGPAEVVVGSVRIPGVERIRLRSQHTA